jgi:hypothetical protein
MSSSLTNYFTLTKTDIGATIGTMKNKLKPEPKVPFNLRGPDADLANRVREHFEKKLSTRLSAVQVARIVYAQVANSEGVA